MLQIDAIEILKDIQGSLEETRIIERCAIDMAIEALKNIQALDKIPTNYLYDTETEHCLVYRHKYTGKEIHILKPTDLFVLERPHGEWITCSERLPEDTRPVIVTWKNTDPASYYQYIVGKHYTGTACYKNGKWYWYSSTTEDLLAEYGRYDSEEFDEAIECIAWMPLPKPYREEGEKE